ncbi:MAG: DUF948 domain-containing protein [Candidatus Krumholzibacteriia bacterium]
MSVALQVAVGLAALAFVALVAVLVPAILQVRRQANQIAATVEQLREDVAALVHDSRDTLAQLGDVVSTVHDWTVRADRILKQVDEAVEPPLLSTVRAIGLARVGLGAFLDVFRHRRRGAE